jgi:hypothetical protein
VLCEGEAVRFNTRDKKGMSLSCYKENHKIALRYGDILPISVRNQVKSPRGSANAEDRLVAKRIHTCKC